MKPTTSIPLIIATALVLGTVGAVATAQDKSIDEQLMSEGPDNTKDHSEQAGKSRHDKNRKMQGSRHAMQGKPGSNIMHKLLKNVDANADGAVTQAEIDAFKNAQLSGADIDTDGALNIEEFDTIYRALTRSRMVDMFQDFDENGDGIIDSAEMDERIGHVVERLDRNDDGALSREDAHRRGNR